MSYINVSVTRPVAAALGPGSTDTIAAGFSREGGRLEYVDHTTGNPAVAPGVIRRLEPDEPLRAAASGLLSAVQASGFVQDIVVAPPGEQTAADVSWTYRNGVPGGNAPAGAVPAAVQAVIDAATQLDSAAHSELSAVPTEG